MALRIRAERFGAMVAMDAPAAIVAVDRLLARRLGADGGALWDGPDPGLGVPALVAPVEVHLSATARCPAPCPHCYLDAKPDGHEPTAAELRERLDALAAQGVFRVAFGGGEPALREDLPEIAAHARALGITPTLTTSGLGVRPERAEAFRVFAQVNVSYDGERGVYDAVRAYDGAPIAERAIERLAAAGVRVGVNTVLTRASFPHVRDTAARAESLGASEIQLLRLKPSGRARLAYLAQRLDDAQIAEVAPTLRALSTERSLAVRVDCALVPFLAADTSLAPELLVRFGILGCEAGRSLAAQRADGSLGPCSFWAPGGATGSWETDATLSRFRAYAAAPPEPCASCPYRASCRGGCRIVAGAVGGDPFAPDPECPRVRAHTRTSVSAAPG